MNKDIAVPLALGIGTVILALGAKYAQAQGYIDRDTVLRLVIGANGLMIAYFGNRMPKVITPSECARKATRVGGWSLALSGLIYTGLWALAPIPVAKYVGASVVLGGMLVTLGYCLWLRSQYRKRPQRFGDTA